MVEVPGIELSPSTFPTGGGGVPGVGIVKKATQYAEDIAGRYLDLYFDGKAREQSGRISEKYQKRAEERADKRNRELIADQPFLSVEGRRKAGLNPYGDVVLPGMSGASSISTDAPAMSTSLDSRRLTLDGYVALKQLENDSKVANAEVNLKGAQAENLRGVEKRAGELHGFELELKEIGVSDAKINNFINIATRDTKIAMTNQELNNLVSEGVLLISDIVNRDADTELKMALIEDTYSQIAYREVQSRLAEAKINLTEAEVKQCFANINLLSAQELVALSEGKLTEAQAEQIKEQTKGIEIENELNRRYGAAERITGMVYDGLDSLSGVVDSVAELLPWSKLSKALSGETKRADNAEKMAESAYERGYREAKTDVDEMTKRRMYGADY